MLVLPLILPSRPNHTCEDEVDFCLTIVGAAPELAFPVSFSSFLNFLPKDGLSDSSSLTASIPNSPLFCFLAVAFTAAKC